MHATSIGQRLVPLHWRGLCHPIAIYIARCDEQPDSFDRSLDFAAVLLYVSASIVRCIARAGWGGRIKPAPAPESPFGPYDLTAEAAGHLTHAVQLHAALSPNDLFGLKRSALDGLRRHPR
jgi:hypothetical protein